MKYQIKSFKHDGHLHRVWLENWKVPDEHLRDIHIDERMYVFVNSQTKIREADGKEWVSRIPGVSFFLPERWFNVVALIEDHGVRYYCNLASPPLQYGNVLTYIDYDLDVIKLPNGTVQIVDEEEYQRHKKLYHYPLSVEEKVNCGLQELLDRIRIGSSPFDDGIVYEYYSLWKNAAKEDGGGK
ncbi:DUF402 domain-containing protein [Paenibacillus turpanensis]|uniref:DUF402 domain-containing protein n=1 Tax=Paenibacillus turpanensis TaxID=2689078 RepID=UPI00140C3313|nr:DUF402 domain-containing protein [Paenibacillus turpanensis]